MIDKTREIALKILYKIDKEDAYSNIELNEQIKQNRKNLTEKDIGLISEIVYGVTTWRLTLDEIIKKYSKIKIKKISPWILNILRMGIYQIIFLDKIPKSAAVNESVNLAKRYGHASSSNFVNAILRKIEKNDYEEFFKIEDDIERISKTTSMPKWIVEELMKSNDEKEVEQICKNSNIKPKVTIRVNTLKINKQELIERLKEKNTECKETAEKLDDFLILEKIKNIENIDEFKKGYFTIQDISAGQTVRILNPQPGELVLDACSAPGGKTTYMAELMKNKGKIEAWDIHEHRTKLVEKNAQRLGIDIIETKVKDASLYDESLKEKFNKILLDVPCLGIGVIKRKPDIKWQRKPEDIEKITEIQKKILNNCSKYLKNNGTIVYSTCSILKDENEEVVNEFLKENSEYYIKPEETRNILPNQEEDGFFICKIYKK
jgi:ribosomal RNA small subunit methyltransferase B